MTIKNYIGIVNHYYKYPIQANNKEDAWDELHRIICNEFYEKNIVVFHLVVKVNRKVG